VMRTLAFTDEWRDLNVYDENWALTEVTEVLESLSDYEHMGVEAGTWTDDQFAAPLRVVFELTQKCNMNCAFCYNSSGTRAHSFTDERVRDVTEQLCDLEVLDVVLTGGEVLIVPERLTASIARLTSHGVGVHVLTNGWAMTSESARFFSEQGVLSVQVSIDGADPDIHDMLRRRKGAWKRAVEAVGILKRAHCYTEMAAVVTRVNQHTMEDYIDFAYCLGADRVLIGDVLVRGRAIGTCNELRLSDTEYLDFLGLIRAKAMEYKNLMPIFVGSDEALSLKLQVSKRPEGFLIRGDGSVTPGCQLPVPLGNVNSLSLREIWRDNFRDLRANRPVMRFLEQLRVVGLGDDRVLRVVQNGFSPTVEEEL